MLSGFFPIIALSNHSTFSQTQTDATVPLNINLLNENFVADHSAFSAHFYILAVCGIIFRSWIRKCKADPCGPG